MTIVNCFILVKEPFDHERQIKINPAVAFTSIWIFPLATQIPVVRPTALIAVAVNGGDTSPLSFNVSISYFEFFGAAYTNSYGAPYSLIAVAINGGNTSPSFFHKTKLQDVLVHKTIENTQMTAVCGGGDVACIESGGDNATGTWSIRSCNNVKTTGGWCRWWRCCRCRSCFHCCQCHCWDSNNHRLSYSAWDLLFATSAERRTFNNDATQCKCLKLYPNLREDSNLTAQHPERPN